MFNGRRKIWIWVGRSVGRSEIIHWKERKKILRLHMKNFNKSYYLIHVHLQGRSGLLNIRSNWSRLIKFPENGSKDFPERARNIHCGFPRRISCSFKISKNALSIEKKRSILKILSKSSGRAENVITHPWKFQVLDFILFFWCNSSVGPK